MERWMPLIDACAAGGNQIQRDSERGEGEREREMERGGNKAHRGIGITHNKITSARVKIDQDLI